MVDYIRFEVDLLNVEAGVVNGVFWFDGRALGHGGRTRFRQHRVLRGRSVARLQRVTLLVRPRGVRQDSTTSLATPERGCDAFTRRIT